MEIINKTKIKKQMIKEAFLFLFWKYLRKKFLLIITFLIILLLTLFWYFESLFPLGLIMIPILFESFIVLLLYLTIKIQNENCSIDFKFYEKYVEINVQKNMSFETHKIDYNKVTSIYECKNIFIIDNFLLDKNGFVDEISLINLKRIIQSIEKK